MELTNILKRFLMNGVPKMVVKMNNKAKEYETLDIMKKADIFVAASLKIDTFNAYRYSIDSNTLIKLGIFSRAERQRILKDTKLLEREYGHLIPQLMEHERQKTINGYVEQNQYYRTISGQPDLGDMEFIYPDIRILEQYGFTELYPEDDYEHRTPLHLLPYDTLMAMESAGILDDIQSQYPTKFYISHLASRKISLVEARRAQNFDLLYFPRQDGNNRFYRDFLFYYEEAREYFTSAIYNHQFATKYAYYDGFIGLMILTMTIQRMISNLFKIVVERDFYDLATLRLFLESFGVPFVDIFTLQQQRMLVKNLNILLMKKQGTSVMYDILDLLGYDSFQLSKYVLVKQHKMYQENVESDFKPIFIYKSSVNEKGLSVLEIDSPSTFDYYFVGIDMKETDVRLVDTTAENSYSYDEFTENDSTWINDDELITKLEESDFNFIETKYADIAINIRMQDKMFEMVYLSRMLLDKAKETDNIKVSLARISENPFSLLEIEVFLICLMCKNKRMVPNILRRPSQILAVLGFDFTDDIETIKNDIIKENEDWKYHHGVDLYDMEVIEYLKTVTFNTAKDVNDFYVTIRDLEGFLSYAMLTTHSVDAYHAYRKLYNTIMITQITDESYQDDLGNPVYRYDDYLRELNIELYTFFERLTKEQCPDYINYIATKFSTLFEDTEYMGLIDLGDAALIEGILKIIKTFKSLTLELKDLDIVYVFDSRTRNTMRLFAKMRLESTLCPKEIPIHYSDWNNFMSEDILVLEELNLVGGERIINDITNAHEASFFFNDTISSFDKQFVIHDGVLQRYSDGISQLEDILINTKDRMGLSDKGRALLVWDGEEPRVIGGTPK